MYEAICDALHREMDLLEEKYASGKTAMTAADLEHIDRMAHALKSLATYEAMKTGSREYRSRGTRYIREDGYRY